MACDAGIRPFPNDTEVRCTVPGDHHARHSAPLRDYAYPGSVTEVHWIETDRRTFHGEWPGSCPEPSCPLPLGHRGDHVE